MTRPVTGMAQWPDRRVIDLLRIAHPIILSPMPGVGTEELAVAVCTAGGLGMIGCALDTPDATVRKIASLRDATRHPFGVNFFCHTPALVDVNQERIWLNAMQPYYRELGIPFDDAIASRAIPSFDDAMCDAVARASPAVVSFHFGLPPRHQVHGLKAAGCVIMSSATTVEEACWLEENGADIVIAQGADAGGHRAMFLAEDPVAALGGQLRTLALIPQVVAAVGVPVVAAGGIADGRAIAAAIGVGASGVQIGTGYLRCPETAISPSYRRALESAGDGATVLTNVFTGRPARAIGNRLVRELGPLSRMAPAFPAAMGATQRLASAAQDKGITDFTPFWAGEAVASARALPAAKLTELLAREAMRAFAAPV